jgi:hypothetical protein
MWRGRAKIIAKITRPLALVKLTRGGDKEMAEWGEDPSSRHAYGPRAAEEGRVTWGDIRCPRRV